MKNTHYPKRAIQCLLWLLASIHLLFISCKPEETTPHFVLESYSYLTHNSVLIKYRNQININDNPSGIRVMGKIASSSDTVNYFIVPFSPTDLSYSVMLYDLLPDREYEIAFFYGHYNISSPTYRFKTKDVDFFTDPRDGHRYPVGQIGNQWWMLENLAFQTPDAFHLPDSLLTGLYYIWESALTACPQGWHLPSDEEWIELERYIGVPENDLYDTSQRRGTFEMAKLLTPATNSLYGGLPDHTVVNELGFSLRPTGYYSVNDTQNTIPQGFYSDGFYWSSTAFSHFDAYIHGSLSASTNGSTYVHAMRIPLAQEYKMCVRCIKD